MKILISFLQSEDTTSPNNKWKCKEKIVTQAMKKKRNKAVRTLILEEKEKQHQNRWWSRLMIYKQFDSGYEPEGRSYTQGESVTEVEDYKIQ